MDSQSALKLKVVQQSVFRLLFSCSSASQPLRTDPLRVFRVNHRHGAVLHPGITRRIRQRHTVPVRILRQKGRGVAGAERVFRAGPRVAIGTTPLVDFRIHDLFPQKRCED